MHCLTIYPGIRIILVFTVNSKLYMYFIVFTRIPENLYIFELVLAVRISVGKKNIQVPTMTRLSTSQAINTDWLRINNSAQLNTVNHTSIQKLSIK